MLVLPYSAQCCGSNSIKGRRLCSRRITVSLSPKLDDNGNDAGEDDDNGNDDDDVDDLMMMQR